MRKKEAALFPESDWVEQGFKTSFLPDWCSAVLDGRGRPSSMNQFSVTWGAFGADGARAAFGAFGAVGGSGASEAFRISMVPCSLLTTICGPPPPTVPVAI